MSESASGTSFMRKKPLNISRREREARPVKPELSFLGIIAGLIVGWLTGLAWEVALNKPERLVMLTTGFVGVALGGALEGVRYWIRLRRFKAARQS